MDIIGKPRHTTAISDWVLIQWQGPTQILAANLT